MSSIVFFSAMFSSGALLAMRAATSGRTTLARQFAALRPVRTQVLVDPDIPAVFSSKVMERRLRPVLEYLGTQTQAAVARFGLSSERSRQRLAATADRHGLGLFWGQKIACGIVGFAILPVAREFNAAPQTPAMVWVVFGLAGLFAPDIALKSKATAAHAKMRSELVRLAELLALAVSAGLGVESAIEEATATETGRLFSEMRAATRQGAMRGQPLPETLAPLPDQLGLPELEPLVAAISAAATQGLSLGGALRAQVRTLRDRRRTDLIAAGERAQVRMLLPVGGLILPAFLLVVLYPAAVQLLKLGG